MVIVCVSEDRGHISTSYAVSYQEGNKVRLISPMTASPEDLGTLITHDLDYFRGRSKKENFTLNWPRHYPRTLDVETPTGTRKYNLRTLARHERKGLDSNLDI